MLDHVRSECHGASQFQKFGLPLLAGVTATVEEAAVRLRFFALTSPSPDL